MHTLCLIHKIQSFLPLPDPSVILYSLWGYFKQQLFRLRNHSVITHCCLCSQEIKVEHLLYLYLYTQSGVISTMEVFVPSCARAHSCLYGHAQCIDFSPPACVFACGSLCWVLALKSDKGSAFVQVFAKLIVARCTVGIIARFPLTGDRAVYYCNYPGLCLFKKSASYYSKTSAAAKAATRGSGQAMGLRLKSCLKWMGMF